MTITTGNQAFFEHQTRSQLRQKTAKRHGCDSGNFGKWIPRHRNQEGEERGTTTKHGRKRNTTGDDLSNADDNMEEIFAAKRFTENESQQELETLPTRDADCANKSNSVTCRHRHNQNRQSGQQCGRIQNQTCARGYCYSTQTTQPNSFNDDILPPTVQEQQQVHPDRCAQRPWNHMRSTQHNLKTHIRTPVRATVRHSAMREHCETHSKADTWSSVQHQTTRDQ